MNITINQIIEMNLAELISCDHQLEVGSIEAYYCKILQLYLKSDIDGLRIYIDHINRNNENSLIFEISKLRLQIREKNISRDLIELVVCLSETNKILRGETLFVCAMAFEVLGDEERAAQYYYKSAKQLQTESVYKKSLKAEYNAIAAKSRANSNVSYLVEYNVYMRKAKKLRLTAVVGVCYTSMASEYVKIGAYRAALKFQNKALQYLSNYDFGSLDYFHALINRAYILYSAGNFTAANFDIEIASTSGFKEIHEVVNLLNMLIKKDLVPQSINIALLTPIWKERFKNILSNDYKTQVTADAYQVKSKKQNFSDMEESLIYYLSSGAKDKFEIVDHLYGNKIDFEVLENRFKNLLIRIRSKDKNLVFYANGKYHLGHEMTYSSLKWAHAK